MEKSSKLKKKGNYIESHEYKHFEMLEIYFKCRTLKVSTRTVFLDFLEETASLVLASFARGVDLDSAQSLRCF